MIHRFIMPQIMKFDWRPEEVQDFFSAVKNPYDTYFSPHDRHPLRIKHYDDIGGYHLWSVCFGIFKKESGHELIQFTRDYGNKRLSLTPEERIGFDLRMKDDLP